MTASFETNDSHAHAQLKLLRVAMRVDQVFEEAKELVEDMPDWAVVTLDAAAHVLVCRRSKGFLSGEARLTITCTGPEDLPSTVVHVRSETTGGIVARDRKNVLAFTVPFHRRVC